MTKRADDALKPYDAELVEELRHKAFLARGYREELFLKAAAEIERLWGLVQEHWGNYNDALDQWNTEIELRQKAEAAAEEFRSILLEVARRIETARALLAGETTKEGSGEDPS